MQPQLPKTELRTSQGLTTGNPFLNYLWQHESSTFDHTHPLSLTEKATWNLAALLLLKSIYFYIGNFLFHNPLPNAIDFNHVLNQLIMRSLR
jgi:hypothetical protein